MNSKFLIIAVVVVIVIGGGAYLLLKSNGVSTPAPSPTQNQTVTQAPTQTEPSAESTKSKEKTVEVSLTSQGYNPQTITIEKGTKVIWTNNSGQAATVNSDPHPIHTDFPPLNLGNFEDGENLELVFNETGTYKYHNHLNSTDKGTIIVK